MTQKKIRILNPCNLWPKSAVVPDRLNGTTCQRLFAKHPLFLGLRLLVDKRVIVLIATHEVIRRRVAANVAVNARRINVVATEDVLFYFVVFIGHARICSQGCVMSSGITSLSNSSPLR